MITRRMGRHALLRLFVGEAEDRVGRTTRLEGSRFLEVLAFEEQFSASKTVDVAGRQHWCLVHIWPNPLVRCDHIFKGRQIHRNPLYVRAHGLKPPLR